MSSPSLPLVVLAILDGWGIAPPGPGNALTLAHLPHLTKWLKEYPSTTLQASGAAVGLPDGVTGNSEVGHMNLGAGYILPQDEVRINQAIADGSWEHNQALAGACKYAREHQSNLHLLCLVGPGQVHSNIEHLWAMLQLAQSYQVPTYVHAFADGRDSSPTWLGKNAPAVQQKIESFGGQLVSVVGRYYALDRDQRWDRIELAYRLLTERKGQIASSLELAVQHSYDKSKTDEFLEPTVIGNGKSIQDGDAVVFLNFRTDRPRQLTEAFVDPQFNHFARSKLALFFATMTEYQADLPVSAVAFGPEPVEHPLAEVIAGQGLTQLHAAETEKYAHVTYFFNGGREEPFEGEQRILVPSPKVATYDLQPAMSAPELTDKVITFIEQHSPQVVIINFANADMVGHTGNVDATIAAAQVVDECLGRLEQVVTACNGALLITADHGNAEVLIKPDGSIDTEHNPNPVPLLAVGQNLPGSLRPGALSNVAPTLLQLLMIAPPPAMTATSLWESHD